MAKSVSTPARHSQIKPTDLVGFHRALAKWYKNHGRHDLPWRNTDDPYRIWLSEVMLQQTQVSTVRARFYEPFLEKFPSVKALADAPREAVMKAWEGLGYYRRAGNLHDAAKIISGLSPRRMTGSILATKKKDGPRNKSGVTATGTITFPNTIDDLLALPGIGRNTAHAIAAFAYHQPVAILEANVKRVVARIFALETPDDKTLWAGAETLLNHQHPFDYNQAMMDLGSLICTPKNPKCQACPANSICAGKATPERYPAPKRKKLVPTKEVIIHVREDASGRLFLETRDAKFLGGLYGFPQSPHTPSSRATPRDLGQRGETSPSGLRSRLKAGMTAVGTVTHVYSHFKLVGHVVLEKVTMRTNSEDWHSRAQITALPLSKLDHKVLALVDKCNSAQKKRPKAKPHEKTR